MTSSQKRVDRALAWRETLPEGRRPSRQDVEIAARLHVTQLPVMTRILWEDQRALGRCFSELAAVLDREEDSQPSPSERAPAQAPPATRSTRAPQPAAALMSWIESLRANGDDVPIDEKLTLRLTGIRTEDELYRITVESADRRRWREFLRHNGAALASVLGLEPSDSPGAPAPAAQTQRRTGATSPDGFTGGNQPTNQMAPNQITFPTSETDGIALAWKSPADDAEVLIYRVVARLDTFAWDLDLSDKSRMVATTFDTTAVDPQPFTGAKRYYSVFMNTGPTEAAARASQPVLWAEGVAIQPVHDAQIGTTGRRVSGRWTVSAQIDRVEVLRVPVQDPPLQADVYDTEYVISGTQHGQNLDGFTDEDVPSGRWEYRIYACASANGTMQRSPLVRSFQTIATELPVAKDLTVDVADEDRFLISWLPLTDPGLTVRIHKRLEQPPAGVSDRTLDAAGLERIGFSGTAITDPERLVNGRAQVESPWLPGEDRVYFTAVTAAKGLDQYRVGQTVVRNRVGEVRHLELVERVDEQFLTFAWPDGAGVVKVFRSSPDLASDSTDLSKLVELAELTPTTHAQFGGVHLNLLPSDGAVLHVVGLSYNESRPTQGPPARVRYHGLVRIHYAFESVTKPVRQGWFRKVDQVTGKKLVATARDNITGSLPLVLVHNQERLPLHQDDGQRVPYAQTTLQPEAPQVRIELPTEALPGYLRLFLDLPEQEQEKYAVIDPPLTQLWHG